MECYVGTAFATMEPTTCDYGVVNCKTEVKGEEFSNKSKSSIHFYIVFFFFFSVSDLRTDFSCGSGLASDTGGCRTSSSEDEDDGLVEVKTCFCPDDLCNDDPNKAISYQLLEPCSGSAIHGCIVFISFAFAFLF